MARRRKKRLPEGLFEAEIESLSHDGRGIAHLDGKVIFIDGALPSEKVKFQYSFQRKQFDEGVTKEVLVASPQRVQEPCVHASNCGGCSLQHMSSEAQVELKQAAFLDQFKHIAGIEVSNLLPVLQGATLNYRRKARLAVKYVAKKEKVLVGFREKRNTFIADIDRCEVLINKVGHQLVEIAEMVEGLEARSTLPQIEVAQGSGPVALVFRHLEDLCDSDVEKIKAFCSVNDFEMFLQSGGPKTVKKIPLHGEEEELAPRLSYHYAPDDLEMRFHPNDFIQVNEGINEKMIEQSIELMNVSKDDIILDLFCGLGNFSLPLAKRCKTLVGVEGSEEMVVRAGENALLNKIDNCEFYAWDLTQSITGLKQDDSSWVNIPFNKMLIDPPRSGAEDIVKSIDAWPQIERIVYVSCNPATLARDTQILLSKGFKLESAGIMDMFPHTNHVESMAVFTK